MIKETRCEIISVGTELLLGQITDTNSAWLSEKLADAGINVFFKQTVGDNYNRLFSVFEKAQSRSNIVFVTGGLGPTDDDLTRDVAASLFNTNLEIDEDTFDTIKSIFKKNNKHMTDNNHKQALKFTNSIVFNNEVGLAPCLHYIHKGVWWFFLPGVPREMKWLVEQKVLPYLNESGLITHQLYSRILTFNNIGESTLETELQDLIREQTNPTIAPLAGNGYVRLRLTSLAQSKEEADDLLNPLEKKILNRVKQYFVGYGDLPLEIQVLEQLKNKHLNLSSCESITGGLFASTIIQHSGASNVFNGSIVSYTDEVKKEIVGVSEDILETHGAISEPCAKAMAENCRNKFKTDLAISFTGIAGTDPVQGFAPGTVFIGVTINNETICKKVELKGDRNAIREGAVTEGLKLLYSLLKKFGE
ncbi:competence/damage-inducible protein A [Filobacillus milosensis]|uniref:Putative competence-damage inducible protein n=1 Tax=Filobacillus milosensis TaxID=94137 RepID=A0A4Y8INI0_9BACI|nr:competence/damage-inducible protein A [Filobacillus milosensis]TFB23143.1 competence/damage-inducible protein A [Filobacillus milosensis]